MGAINGAAAAEATMVPGMVVQGLWVRAGRCLLLLLLTTTLRGNPGSISPLPRRRRRQGKERLCVCMCVGGHGM